MKVVLHSLTMAVTTSATVAVPPLPATHVRMDGDHFRTDEDFIGAGVRVGEFVYGRETDGQSLNLLRRRNPATS